MIQCTLLISLTALTLWSAASVSAACPTPEAMDGRGVLVTTAAGDVELHQRTRPQTIQIAVNFGGGDGSVLEMHHGIYLKRQYDLVGGVLQPESEEVFMGTRGAQAWNEPQPGKVWQNAQRGGGSAASSAANTIRIGACRYSGFDVSIRYTSTPNTVKTYAYLPEFGIGLLTRNDENGDVQTYRYVTITAY